MLKVFALSVAMVATAAVTQTQFVRPSDTDVKNLIGQVGQSRDRFQDALDSKLKSSILRGASGEVNVDKFLDDLKRNADQMRDRYNSDYAASTEVLTLLRQGTDIHTFMSGQAGAFKGKSEWEAFASVLGTLATAYGTSFPLPQGASARRMNDKEVAVIADTVALKADQFLQGGHQRHEDREGRSEAGVVGGGRREGRHVGGEVAQESAIEPQAGDQRGAPPGGTGDQAQVPAGPAAAGG